MDADTGTSPILRIELDDQVLVDVRQDILARRHRLENAAHLLVVHLDPLGKTHLCGESAGRLDTQLLLGFSRTVMTSPALHW